MKFIYKGENKKSKVMAPLVGKYLEQFCSQEQEFEQAINQSGQTFNECMDSISNRVSNSVSDFDVINMAVDYYFPGSKISYQVNINLSGDADEVHEEPPKKKKSMTFSLEDLF